jgi:hypothetical protein
MEKFRPTGNFESIGCAGKGGKGQSKAMRWAKAAKMGIGQEKKPKTGLAMAGRQV